jgi:CheY-like chemotaxis protein
VSGRRASDRNQDEDGSLRINAAAREGRPVGSGRGKGGGEGRRQNAEEIAMRTKLAGVCVLLVEDDDDSRNLLSLILERYGAEVISASSSNEALDLFVQQTPDVVISDIGMVGEDGYELIRKLRLLPVQGSLLTRPSALGSDSTIPRSSFLADVPAIALTGYATLKDRERALAAGYRLHLAKPIEPEMLVTAIVTLLE